MKKFWNKAEDTDEILIFGEIVSEKWFESDVTAKEFADDLKSFGGKDVTLRINSGGGDVFSALAIANVIKRYKGKVKCSIDGLAASAATLITCACDTVTIANNALMMIHDPAVGLLGYFDETEIEKVQKSLSAVKSSIVQTYTDKTGKTADEISEIMSAETWYTATEAKENNFVDEISGEVDAEFDDVKNLLFVNSLQVDCKNFDVEKFKNKVRLKKMSDKADLAKMKNLSGEKTEPAKVEIKDTADFIAEVREKEISRIRNLNAMKTGNKIVDGIIDVAIKDGATIEEIQKYVDVVKNVQDTEQKNSPVNSTLNQLEKIIVDNMNSGAEGVTGSAPQMSDDEKKQAEIQKQAKMLADFANGLI